jgi:transposase InsO family protein
MPQPDLKFHLLRRAANRQLGARILDAADVLGGVTGPEAALAAFGWPSAIRRRRLHPVIQPTATQLSTTRRAIARLMKARVLVADPIRRMRRKVYRRAQDAALLGSISIGSLND